MIKIDQFKDLPPLPDLDLKDWYSPHEVAELMREYARASGADREQRPAALPDPRDEFERKFPIPHHCQRSGTGYAATAYNAWSARSHIDRWEGWEARGADRERAKPVALTDEQIVKNLDEVTATLPTAISCLDFTKGFARAIEAKVRATPVTGEPMTWEDGYEQMHDSPAALLAQAAIDLGAMHRKVAKISGSALLAGEKCGKGDRALIYGLACELLGEIGCLKSGLERLAVPVTVEVTEPHVAVMHEADAASFKAWCPYSGNPDPWVVWQAARADLRAALAQQSDFRVLESVSATTRPCRDKTPSDTATEAQPLPRVTAMSLTAEPKAKS